MNSHVCLRSSLEQLFHMGRTLINRRNPCCTIVGRLLQTKRPERHITALTCMFMEPDIRLELMAPALRAAESCASRAQCASYAKNMRS